MATAATPRILVRSGKAPHHVVSAEGSLARNGWGVFGANVGNLLFSNSVFQSVNIPGARVVSDSLITEQASGSTDAHIERINDEFDAYIVPLANAFRPQFERSLRRLTRVIERLRIPVVVVGVGVQNVEGDAGALTAGSSVDEAATAFVRAVLDRSATIGVRGETTEHYLASLGFNRDLVDIIGCPSLNTPSPVPISVPTARLADDAQVAMNLTPSADRMGEVVATNVAAYRNLVYIPQEVQELAFLLWGEPLASWDERLPMHHRHPLVQDGRVRFFLDPTTWMDFLAGCEFAFGTRIHGTIAALAAGTPAFLLSHDPRTLELAEYHRIPHRRIIGSGSVLAADLAQEADFAEFNAFRRESFDRYRAFLDRNSVQSVFAPGMENADYADLLASTAYPEAVVPFTAESAADDQLLSRVRWLRQGANVDRARWFGGYIPPFKPRPRSTTDERLEKVEAQLATALAEIEQLRDHQQRPRPSRIASLFRR